MPSGQRNNSKWIMSLHNNLIIQKVVLKTCLKAVQWIRWGQQKHLSHFIYQKLFPCLHTLLTALIPLCPPAGYFMKFVLFMICNWMKNTNFLTGWSCWYFSRLLRLSKSPNNLSPTQPVVAGLSIASLAGNEGRSFPKMNFRCSWSKISFFHALKT